jgi:PAS domain S-box-containing protein
MEPGTRQSDHHRGLTRSVTVRGTEISAGDSREVYRQKIARIALDSMVQFVGLLDASGTVLEINKVALDAVGISLSDVEGRPFSTTFWWQVSEEVNATLRESIARAANGEFVRWDTPIYGRAGGKETIIIDASLCPVTDEHGNVVFICAEGRDITEKKAYEREIAQKNVDLQSLLERIRELDDIKTQFFANVSHELRTPLALIIGPAERLMKPDSVLTPEEQRETAQVIVRNARMLLKHVNDLLDISKLEAKKLKLELQDTDVAALVRFMASHFEILAGERGVALHVEVPPSCISAVDAEKLQRVVMNLLSNAFKFAPAGGTVRCRLQTTSTDLVLSVEDSGPGVEPRLRTAIFERFRQGDGGANRETSGTGLGLAIAQEFVEMHKGAIEVLDSDLGGARFRVTVPVHRLSAAVEVSPQQAPDRSALDGLLEELRLPPAAPAPDGTGVVGTEPKPTVLVVEDNPDMNRFVAQCLSHDYDVVCAFDGQQGLEKALAVQPVLIVSDIMMPRVSGVDMIAALRKRPEMQETPILLLSAKADDELKVRLLEGGAQDFVTKPFTERDLLARVRNLMAIKQAREALRARSQELDELFQQAPSFMAVLRGPDHVVELANAASRRLVGDRAIDGKRLLDALPELGKQGFVDLLDRVLETGEPYVGTAVPVVLQREPGRRPEERYVDFVSQPLAAPGAGFNGVFVEGHDVTDRKHAEDALRAADRRKDEFLATLAHELRNPLAPIRHAAKIGKSPRATDAQVKWAQDVIDRQVDHMSRLLDDLLEVSRITRGTLELRTERLSVQQSLIAAVETARPLIEARGHTLSIDVPERTIYVDADPVRFAQIFLNLLTNAAKYTDPGGAIRVEAGLRHDTVVVKVHDTGIGIAPELLPRVFEMFSQATSALERSEGGLGIGLALTRGLVLLHGGSIEARSRGLGRGSEFVVTLPVLRDEIQSVTAAGAVVDAGSEPRRLRVLVADDNRDNADTCAMLLRLGGQDVRTAYSGHEALAVAAEFAPEVALLDIGMPGMSGYEVARKLRATTGDRKVLLVAVTGWGQTEDKRQALAAGFDHHLSKPVDLAVLQQVLESCRDVGNE